MSFDRRLPLVGFCTEESYPHTAKDGHVLFVRVHWASLMVGLLVSRRDHRKRAGSDVGFGSAARVNRSRPILSSRGSFFVVILLLLSDPDELGCSALFSSALTSLTFRA